MMLTKISIQGFKSIHKISELELGQVNVFIGANGSGKSNLLEAVGVLGAAISGRIDNESLSRRGVRLSPSELYKTNLQEKEVSELVDFEVDSKWGNSHAKYQVSLKPSFDSDRWEYEVENLFQDGQLRSELPENRNVIRESEYTYSVPFPASHEGKVSLMLLEGAPQDLRNFLNGYAIFSPTTPVLRGVQPDISARDPLGLLGGRLAEAIQDILDQEKETFGKLDLDEVLDLLDWVGGVDIKPPSRELLSADVPSVRSVIEFRDLWMGRKRNRISGYDASEGSLYVLFMLALASHPRAPGFFAIDNFGQAMNPRLERALSRLFCQLILDSDPSRQVLLTTHNPLVLDGLNLRDDRIRLFAVERSHSTQGATKISRVRLSAKVLKTAENGTPLSQMWTMGLLGGVPDIF